jgi:hypothetical protein
MGNAAFDFFEEICSELRGRDESVLIDKDFSPSTLEDIKRSFRDPATSSAIGKAMHYLRSHFENRGSALPFEYDLGTGRAMALHREYIEFVSDAQDQRSLPAGSKDFEVATSQRLATRLTGILCRVGSPRTRYKRRQEFAAYLVKQFQFEERVLVNNDKDGGLDILWFPPLGAFPLRAMVSVQCKNSLYDRDDGFRSVGRAKQTFRRHTYAKAEEAHLHCVVYNDYIDERLMENAREAGFVPLGLSDLAPLTAQVSLDLL